MGSDFEIHRIPGSSHTWKVAVDAKDAEFFERLQNAWQALLETMSKHKLEEDHSESVYSHLAQSLREVSDQTLSIVNVLLPGFTDSDIAVADLGVPIGVGCGWGGVRCVCGCVCVCV